MDIDTVYRYRYIAFSGACSIIALGVTATLVTSLWRRSMRLRVPSRLSVKRLILFACLGTVCLSITCFVGYLCVTQSYRQWLDQAYPPYNGGPAKLPPLARLLHMLGWESLPEKRVKQQQNVAGTIVSLDLVNEWLSASNGFSEAGKIASATPARFWWTQQLLSILPGWALFMGWQGRRYRVSHVCAFMLLAQLVSVSFAVNLFFVAVILSPIGRPADKSQSAVIIKKTERTADRSTTREELALRERASYVDTSQISDSPLVAWSLFLSVVGAAAAIPVISIFVDTPYFLPAMAVPHILVFLPTLLPTTNPENLWATYKALFFGLIAIQTLAAAAVVFDVEFQTYLLPLADSVASGAKSTADFAVHAGRALWESRLGFARSQPFLQRILPGYRSSVDYTLARIDHFILVLNTQLPALYHALASATTATIKEIWHNPSKLLTWTHLALVRAQHGTNKVAAALAEHPAVAGIGLDALLCWLSITAWIVTSAGFDDELAEESIEPVLEAQETIKGLAGQNGRPGVPMRTSWFESHIG